MKQKTPSAIRSLLTLIAIVIFAALLLPETSCKWFSKSSKENNGKIDTVSLSNWNIFFGTTTDGTARANLKQGIEDSVRAWLYAHGLNQNDDVIFKWSYCPCDTLLANVNITIVGISTGSVPPPPTKPPVGPSGDYAVNNNLNIEIPEADSLYHQNNSDTGKVIIPGVGSNPQPNNQVLAVIDTGIDTLKFGNLIGSLLWKDPSGNTLFNFLKPDGIDNLSDSNGVKHGTSVTAIALKEIRSHSMPRIMELKAFDKNGKGTIYSVSCALSYAIKNHVTLINTSWGYYGDAVDSVLEYYVKRASDMSIPVITAAGNQKEPPSHSPPYCDNTVPEQNRLSLSHQFFPASLSPNYPNLISVTGLSQGNLPNQLLPCKYQNFCDTIVTVGVFNKPRQQQQVCCQYSIEFLAAPIEGTSFATPVVSGRYLFNLQTAGPGTVTNAKQFLDGFVNPAPSQPFYTTGGRYIVYTQ